MEQQSSWPVEKRRFFSNEFKLRMVELASRPDANVPHTARDNGLNDNLLFKWLRLWQREGRISRRLPATLTPQPKASLLPVELIPDTVQQKSQVPVMAEPSPLNATACRVAFRHGEMTLENPSPELLAILIRELTGRTAT